MKTGMLIAAGAMAAALTGAGLWAHGQGMDLHGPFGPFRAFHGAHDALRALDLTDEQKTEVKSILRSHRQEFKDAAERLRAVHESVGKVAHQETIDEAAIRAGVAQALQPLGDLAVLHAKVQHEIHAVLTPEQRQKAEALREKFHSHLRELHVSIKDLGDDLLEDPS
jgi:Spy/CpxP family protein refolding chaperone